VPELGESTILALAYPIARPGKTVLDSLLGKIFISAGREIGAKRKTLRQEFERLAVRGFSPSFVSH
jgi:hypothetical protein